MDRRTGGNPTMLRNALAILVLFGPSLCAGQTPAPHYDAAWHGSIASSALAITGILVSIGRDTVPACRWCSTHPDGTPKVNGTDTWARSHWRWGREARAGRLSQATVAAAIALPLISLSADHSDVGAEWKRDELVAVESIVVSLAAADAIKRIARRPRPYVTFENVVAVKRDDMHSFISSHAATAFAAVVAGGTIASRRHARSARWIWIGGLALAASTSYLRVASDRHYLSDVLGGAAVGTTSGLVLPRVFDNETTQTAQQRHLRFDGAGLAARFTIDRRHVVALKVGVGARGLGISGTVETH